MALVWDFKDTDERLDYSIDWTDRLVSGDDIVSSTWEIAVGDAALLIDTDSFDAVLGTTTVWLSAGTTGTVYELTNHIVTAANRQMDQTVKLKIKDK